MTGAADNRPRDRPSLRLLLVAAIVLVGAARADPRPATEAGASAPHAIAVLADHPRFQTRPPGSALPTGRTCGRRVTRIRWEPRPGNRKANRTRGVPLVLPPDAWAGFPSWQRLAPRVDGNFTGTTDEIIRWASCKWGFDENATRAQAYVESRWDQNFVGDGGRSVGLMQIKSAQPGTPHRYTWPLSRTSTAYNVDYALAWRRACYDGLFSEGGWLPASSRGDLWGCIGAWYSGAWHEGDGRYVAEVKRALGKRPWLRWRAAVHGP
jgi:hypothetical protein